MKSRGRFRNAWFICAATSENLRHVFQPEDRAPDVEAVTVRRLCPPTLITRHPA
ncbi:MAG: hypothetical protein ABI273_21805 [Lacunisphaera sp.]